MATDAASRLNGASIEPPKTEPLFTADAIKMLRLMRVNPLPMLDPSSLGAWLDQFDIGQLRMAAFLWEAMCKRDDTLITVKPQLENAVASKDWGVFQVEGADEIEAPRHQACLEYFYNTLSVTDAYDRNERGGRDKLIEQMMRSESFFYAVHHFVWKPQPGKTIPMDKGAPVPVISALLEYVPLWFFENTTGTLRFLPDGGFGVDGQDLNWDGEWMCTTGRGLMFAASICYTFKRLTFQDWTIFNERYAQNKVVGQTPAAQGSPQGNAMSAIVSSYNGDQGIVIYESSSPGDKPPISLLGPEGTVSMELFQGFIERQDRKMSAMYRGGDLSTQSRGNKGEQPIGASLQGSEGDDMEKGACRRIAGVCQEFIDRLVIRICFGEGVEPLAYFGLPDMDAEDTPSVRESAGFLADRGMKPHGAKLADRLGIELISPNDSDDDALKPLTVPASPTGDLRTATREATANAATLKADLRKYLGPYYGQYQKAFHGDYAKLRNALEHVVESPNAELQRQNAIALRGLLPQILTEMTRDPQTAHVEAAAMGAVFAKAYEKVAADRAAADTTK
jgi:hypothetical protein